MITVNNHLPASLEGWLFDLLSQEQAHTVGVTGRVTVHPRPRGWARGDFFSNSGMVFGIPGMQTLMGAHIISMYNLNLYPLPPPPPRSPTTFDPTLTHKQQHRATRTHCISLDPRPPSWGGKAWGTRVPCRGYHCVYYTRKDPKDLTRFAGIYGHPLPILHRAKLL